MMSLLADDDLLRPPPQEYLGDDADMPPQLQRVSCDYRNKSERFVLPKGRSYEKQYSNLYFSRLMAMRAAVLARAKHKWGATGVPVADSLMTVEPGRRCIVVGTLYKEMKLKPNILDEFQARELYEAPPPERSKYTADSDTVVMEDQTARIALTGAALPAASLVTGVVMAALGQEGTTGFFEVEDVCFVDMAPQQPLPSRAPAYICLISGLNISGQAKSFLSLEMLVDLLCGHLGGAEDLKTMAKVARVVFCGNSITPSSGEQDNLPQYKKRTVIPETVSHVKELDLVLAQVAATVPVDVMPGANDPTNHIVPQQPLNPCLFPIAARLSSLKSVSNPYDFEANGVRILGTSGQGVDDVYRFSAMENRLDILEATLRWSHLFPTAPDTLSCFPYQHEHRDPFIIAECPHVFFAGNQPEFATRMCTGPDGQQVRLVCVPKFSTKRTVVLVDLESLECRPLVVAGSDAEAAEAMQTEEARPSAGAGSDELSEAEAFRQGAAAAEAMMEEFGGGGDFGDDD